MGSDEATFLMALLFQSSKHFINISCPSRWGLAVKLSRDTVSGDLAMTGVLGIVFFRSLIISPAVPTRIKVDVLVLSVCMCSLISHSPNLTQELSKLSLVK